MKILDFCQGGDELYHYKKSLVLKFSGPRDVVSTGPNNGGYRRDLTAVFNNDCNPGGGMPCGIEADTYEKHMELLASKQLGLIRGPAPDFLLLHIWKMQQSNV